MATTNATVKRVMPLDHYVPQVHLKNFYSSKLGNLMYAIRKGDLKSFTPNAQSVCRIEEGNTNSYLQQDRAVEKFLKGIEPKYNVALSKLTADNIDVECIYVIAGFAAYILVCSPGGMRINSGPLAGAVEEQARLMDSRGLFSRPPPQLAAESLTELLDKGDLFMEIDPKYPQAIGIASILSQTIMFGNFQWDIMINPFDDTPFFTSDFPVAIEKTKDPRVLNRIVPLSPTLAIRIRPDLSFDSAQANFTFASFRRAMRKLSRSEVVSVNTLIVRCAETTVFFRDDYVWTAKFVKKNSKFRIEPRTQRIPYGKGTLLWFTQKVVETQS